jgi:hypothetical protein
MSIQNNLKRQFLMFVGIRNRVEGMKTKRGSMPPSPSAPFRTCANQKSRKHPDVKCPFQATQGEFCVRHSKRPVRFVPRVPSNQEPLTPRPDRTSAGTMIQRWWKRQIGWKRVQRQGPGVCVPNMAENQTDMYSLDSIESIPILYRWSYMDARHHMWVFDVRSLSMSRTDNEQDFLNPYTREPFPEKATRSFQAYCKWLRDRKFCVVHMETIELTPEQIWHQRLLDVTLQYDMLGYHICLNWFEEMSLRQYINMYIVLWELWTFQLQLSETIKHQVVPGWNREPTRLFKWSPMDLHGRIEKRWWQETILGVLHKLVSSAQEKEHKILGALYGMTAFASVSMRVRMHYPWLVEMQEEEY